MMLTDVLPMIRQLSTPDKLKLIRILAEELEANSALLNLEPNQTYNLPTPYNTFGAGEVLMQLPKSDP